MQLGIAIDDTPAFFNEIYANLKDHYSTSEFRYQPRNIPIFRERINRYLYRSSMKDFLNSNDIIFFEWAGRLLVTASEFPKTCGIVTRLHRYEMYEYANQVNWEIVDKIILVSRAKENEFVARFPSHADKVVVIPEAISLDKFPMHKKNFNGDIGTLCNIIPRKRVYELILGFCELLKSTDHFHLHIGGGVNPKFPDYYEAVHNLVTRLGIQDCVTFYDHVANPSDWYGNIDIFISNSYSEGLQVSPMEAMASGCFCISHTWPGAEELLPVENLFSTNSEMIELILSYTQSPELEKSQRKDQMRQIVESNFNVDDIKHEIRHVIEEVDIRPTNN